MILSGYCFSLPFTSAFALSGTITIPLILLLILVSVSMLQFDFSKIKLVYSIDNFLIMMFLAFALLSSVYNNSIWYSSKSINHTAAYFFTFFFNFFYLKTCFINLNYNHKKVCTALVLGVLFASIFGCIEFLSKGIFNIELDGYIPRHSVSEYDPTALGEYIRVRSFIEESGHFAFFLEVLVPICILLIKNGNCIIFVSNRKFLFVFIVVVMLSFILTFSSAGIGIVCLAYLLTFFPVNLYSIFKGILFNKAYVFKVFFLILLIAIFLLIFNEEVGQFIEMLNEVVFGKLSTGSADIRKDRILSAMTLFRGSDISWQLIGFGPGAYDKLGIDSIVSLYFTYLLEVGYVGLILFVLALIATAIKIIHKHNGDNMRFLLFSLICGSIHFLFISNYWYPWFWVSIIAIDLIKPNKKYLHFVSSK